MELLKNVFYCQLTGKLDWTALELHYWRVVGRILELVVYVTSLTHSTTHQGVASRPTLHSLHWTDCTDKPGTGYVSTQGTLVLCSSTYTLAKSVWPFCPLILLTLNAKAV